MFTMWFNSRVWLGIVVAVLVGTATGYAKGHRDGVRETTIVAQADQIKAVNAARAEEQRRTAKQMEIATDANKQRTQALADDFAARAASRRLQERVNQLVAAARHPTAATRSPTTGDALDLLADLLSRTAASATELAAYADRARIAGQQCEADYDALRHDAQIAPKR